MARRTIRINTADGQGHVFEYETDIEGTDNAALQAEVLAALVETPQWNLQTLPDGTTATFLTEIETVVFLT